MIALVLVIFVDLFVRIFTVLLIIRVIASYVARPDGRFMGFIISMTEPILGPIRQIIPATPGLDLAPLVAFLLLQGLQLAVDQLVTL